MRAVFDLKSSPELVYILIVFGLFVVPRVVQRFRLPSAITCVALGSMLGMGTHVFHTDSTVLLMATLGIVAMFLFAGLEVDAGELREHGPIIVQHVVIQLVGLGVAMFATQAAFDLSARPSMLVALALLTPSTGFILDSLASLSNSEKERFWIKSKAIATEIVALFILFLTLQSTTWTLLLTSTLVILLMIALLPKAFRLFAERVLPHAPRTEFAFLVILALGCAFVTRALGVYYLVGAFLVGMTAQRFRKELPALGSDKLLYALELFASFFIPFYFFKAGLHLDPENFSFEAFWIALWFLAIAMPLRVLLVVLHRRVMIKEPLEDSVRISTLMLPTLVFTIVLAEILRDRYDIAPQLFGALIVYTLVNTVVPGFALKLPPPEFNTPSIPRSPDPHGAGPASPHAERNRQAGGGRQHDVFAPGRSSGTGQG